MSYRLVSNLSVIVVKLDEEDIERRGEEIYGRIKLDIEKEHMGKIVAIEVESEDYFIAPTVVEAVKKAREKYPDRPFYIKRIGYRALHKL